MPRIARVSAINHPHHITQRGNNRNTVFFDDEDRSFFLNTTKKYSGKWHLDIWAYCLMPNHVHFLVVPRTEESLARGIGGINLVYTQYINRKYKRSGRLWQNRFFSTIIQEESYLWAVARYIERNPVRANLVGAPEKYPWSSAHANASGDDDILLSDPGRLSKNQYLEYQSYLNQEDQLVEGAIRKATSVGRPLGTEGFVKRLERSLHRKLLLKKPGRPTRKLR